MAVQVLGVRAVLIARYTDMPKVVRWMMTPRRACTAFAAMRGSDATVFGAESECAVGGKAVGLPG